MGMALKVGRNIILDRAFNGIDVLANGHAAAIAEAKDMGIDGLRRHPPPHVQYHIGGLAAHAGEGLQSGTGIGHDTIIFVDQNLTHFDDVLGLLAEQANCLDVLGQTLDPKIEHLLWRISDLEECARGFVYTSVSGLRRQCDGNHQCIDVHMLQLTLGFGFCGMESLKNIADRMVVELLGHAPRYALKAPRGQASDAQFPGRLGGALPLT